MRRSDSELIIGWTNRVMAPILHDMKSISENPCIVAFDMEDVGLEMRVFHQTGHAGISSEERHLLGVTFAAIRDGEVLTEKWDIERPLKLSEIESYIRKWLKLSSREHIYLITHYAPAELRHIRDWAKAVKPENILIIGDDRIHFTTDTLTLIDSLAFFQKGLKAVARFVNMEKITPGKREDGAEWIKHMDEFKRKFPGQFWEYALNDSKILIIAITRFRAFFLKLGIEILNIRKAPTSPAIAIRILRRMMKYHAAKYVLEKKHVERKRKGGVWGWGSNMKAILHKSAIEIRIAAVLAYWGGRREAFGCGFYKEPIIMLDFSGHYSRCGIDQPLPNCNTTWANSTDVATILPCEGYVTIYDWHFPAEIEYPSISIKPDMGTRLTAVKSGESADMTVFELRLAIDRFGLQFDRIEGWVFAPTPNEINHPVREFLLKFRQMKDEAAFRCEQVGLDKEDDLEYYLAKLLGNALVGKFMQAIDEDDEETLSIFLDGYHPRKRYGPKFKKASSYFAPEWAALILGRARGLLGFAFDLTHAITGHTDSTILPYDSERVDAAVKTVAVAGGDLKEGYRADGLWILRSSVYIALSRTTDGKWSVKMTETRDGPKPEEAHHGLPMNKVKEFDDPVIRALNGEPWISPVLHKRHLSKPRTQAKKGVPLGWEYHTECKPNLKWDFKRKLPSDFNIEKDVFTRFVWAEAYDDHNEMYEAEKSSIHNKRAIRHRRPDKTERREREDIRIVQLHNQGHSGCGIAKILSLPERTVYWRLKKLQSKQ